MVLNLFRKQYGELGVVEDSDSNTQKEILSLGSGWALDDLHIVSKRRGGGGVSFS